MHIEKKIFLVLIIILIGIQFIRPVRNQSEQVLSTDITKTFTVPDSILNILKTSCYDCHSNNTNYPFYTNIQPIGWMMDRHIKNGKDKLNFSEFGGYTQRRQISKLSSIISQIEDDNMPLSSYTIMHKDAILTKENKALIMDWLNKTKDNLSSLN
jgi:hypothetical protein